MNLSPTPIRFALAAAFGLATAGAAQAELIETTAPVAFGNSASVTDGESAGSTTSVTSLGSSALPQFNSSLGVLLGTTLILDSTRSQTVTVTALGSGTSNAQKTATGSGSSTTSLSAPGVNSAFAKIEAKHSCTGAKQDGCSSTISPAGTATTLSAPVDAALLDAYVGGGTVLVTRGADLTAIQGAGVFPGAESTTYKLDWAGKIAAEYEYLEHAAPSFDGNANVLTLDLDFGTVDIGQSAERSFSIFNLAGDRVGLDLDSIDFVLGDDQFTFDLLSFIGLGAGGAEALAASLDTSAAGIFAASYRFYLSDADVGAATSRFNNYQLTLNLTGTVTDQPTSAVPEPTTMALLGIGLTGLGWVRRQRRR